MKPIKEIKSDFYSAFAEVSTIPGLTITDTIQIAIAVLSEHGKDRRVEIMKEARRMATAMEMANLHQNRLPIGYAFMDRGWHEGVRIY